MVYITVNLLCNLASIESSWSSAWDDEGADSQVVVLPVPVTAVLSRRLIVLIIPAAVFVVTTGKNHFNVVLAAANVIWLVAVPVSVDQVVAEVVDEMTLTGRVADSEPHVTVASGADEVEVPLVHGLAGWDWQVEEVGIASAEVTGLISLVEVVVDLGVDGTPFGVMLCVSLWKWVVSIRVRWALWLWFRLWLVFTRNDNSAEGHVVVAPVPVTAVLSRRLIVLIIPAAVFVGETGQNHFNVVFS